MILTTIGANHAAMTDLSSSFFRLSASLKLSDPVIAAHAADHIPRLDVPPENSFIR
jgi:hypothetical protein